MDKRGWSSLHCCVPQCTNDARYDTERRLSFHCIPKDPSIRKQWIIKIRRDVGPNFRITGNTVVCSAHFDEANIFKTLTGLRKLKKNSVPTKFQWTAETSMRLPRRKRCVRKWTDNKVQYPDGTERMVRVTIPATESKDCVGDLEADGDGHPKHDASACPTGKGGKSRIRDTPYSCKESSKTFADSRDLTRHSSEHAVPKDTLFQCEYCSSSCRSSANLKSHIERIHFSKPRFRCGFCRKKYHDASSLRNHKYYVRKACSKDLVCRLCRKRLCSRSSLRRHMLLHKGLSDPDVINNTESPLPVAVFTHIGVTSDPHCDSNAQDFISSQTQGRQTVANELLTEFRNENCSLADNGELLTEFKKENLSIGDNGALLTEFKNENLSLGDNGELLTEFKKENCSLGDNGELQTEFKNENLSIGDNGELLTEFKNENLSLGDNGELLTEFKKENCSLGDNGELLTEFKKENLSLGDNGELLTEFKNENLLLGDKVELLTELKKENISLGDDGDLLTEIKKENPSDYKGGADYDRCVTNNTESPLPVAVFTHIGMTSHCGSITQNVQSSQSSGM